MTSKYDSVRCDYQDLQNALDTTAFLGLPRTCNIRSDPWESCVTRDMMIGNVPVVASYYIKPNDLMLYVKDSGKDAEGAPRHFWNGQKPDWIETSEDLAEFAAARLIEHLTQQDYQGGEDGTDT